MRRRVLALACATLLLAGCGNGSAVAKPGSDAVAGADGSDAASVSDVAADGADAAVAVDVVAPIDDATDATASVDSAQALDAQMELDALSDVVDAASPDATGSAETNGADAVTVDGACFSGGLPAEDALVGDVQPGPACAQVADPLWFTAAVPAPSLQVELGWRTEAGDWYPYQDGDWVPLFVGTQGGFMVMPTPRVLLPGQTAPTVVVQHQGFVLHDCAQVATTLGNKQKLVQAPTVDAWYQPDPTAVTYIQFNEPAGKIGASCGIWVEVYWRYRLPDTDQWGQIHVTLRTYIASMAPISPTG